MKELGSNQTEAIYVGDSEVDLQTALNAQMPCALVTWGFRDEDFLHTLPHANEASFIHSPADLLSLFKHPTYLQLYGNRLERRTKRTHRHRTY